MIAALVAAQLASTLPGLQSSTRFGGSDFGLVRNCGGSWGLGFGFWDLRLEHRKRGAEPEWAGLVYFGERTEYRSRLKGLTN